MILAAGNTSNTYSIRTVVAEAHTIRCHHRQIHLREQQKTYPLTGRRRRIKKCAKRARKNHNSNRNKTPRLPRDETTLYGRAAVRSNIQEEEGNRGQIRRKDSVAAAPVPSGEVRVFRLVCRAVRFKRALEDGRMGQEQRGECGPWAENKQSLVVLIGRPYPWPSERTEPDLI